MLHTAKSVSPYIEDKDVKPTYTIIKHSERTNKLALSVIRLLIPCLSLANCQIDSPFHTARYFQQIITMANNKPVNCATTVPNATPNAPIGV